MTSKMVADLLTMADNVDKMANIIDSAVYPGLYDYLRDRAIELRHAAKMVLDTSLG